MNRLSAWAACALWILPWLNPFATGPSTSVLPWLVSLAATAGLLGLHAVAPKEQKGFILENAPPWAWLLAGTASCVIGLVQYVGWSANFSPWLSYTQIGEAFANLRQRNQFATLSMITMATLCWWVVRLHQHKAQTHYLHWGLAALLALGNVTTSSRMGLFQIVLLVGLCLLWGSLRNHGLRKIWLIYVLSYGAGLIFLPWFIGLDPWSHGAFARLHEGDAVCSSRLTLWRNVIALIVQKPWTGWGWGALDFAHFSTLYEGARFCGILDNAHNLPLQLAFALGVPAATLACGVLAWLCLKAKPWKETDPTRQLAWAVLALISLHSLLEYPLWYGPFQMAVAACVLMLRKPLPLTSGKRLPVLTPFKQSFLALLLIASCAYASWDYHRISQIYMKPALRDADYRDNTLAKIQGSWLFQNQVQFAVLTTMDLTRKNAEQANYLAHELLRYSSESRVVEKIIDSAMLLGRLDEARWYQVRYKAAFPEAYTAWLSAHHPPL
jgi:hypothetical protein